MRQWMCNPMILCQKHLGGEHAEHHMFIGSLKKKIRMDGYINNDLLEPFSLIYRHDVLAWELIRRKILKDKKTRLNAHNLRSHMHNTWIDENLFELLKYLPEHHQSHKINKNNSLYLLLTRCENCYLRYETLIKNQINPLNTYYLPPTYNFIQGL